MKKSTVEIVFVILFAAASSLFYFRGLAGVPYHPDESTQIYMSADWEQFFASPANLFWSPDKTADLRQRYRLLDAPLTRMLIGLGRNFAGQPVLAADWDWSRSWAQNSSAGALPDDALLLTSRLAVAWLFPFSLLLIYSIGRQVGGKITAWGAAIFLAINPLVLLHTRRAMAESALLFFALLTIWAMLRLRKHIWLIALPFVLAINSKQSSFALLIPAITALIWQPVRRSLRRWGLQFILFGALAVLAAFVLNPVLWGNPVKAIMQAWQARQDFTDIQVSTLRNAGYGTVTQIFPERLSGALVQTFIAQPAVYDVSNYAEITRSAEWNYFANPLNNLLRGRRGGLPMMGLTLMGFVLGCFHLARNLARDRRALALLLIASLAQSIVLIALFEIVFQRYYLLLVPYICLWSGYAVQGTLDIAKQAARHFKQDDKSKTGSFSRQDPV